MYYRDQNYEKARSRIFSSAFFINNLSFKEYYHRKELAPQDFLTEEWFSRFYNVPIKIDENNTIIVSADNRYSYYKELPEDKKFYKEQLIPTPIGYFYAGRKYRFVF